jgi:predicted neutral ceramidase superfamily lipid hydrolase
MTQQPHDQLSEFSTSRPSWRSIYKIAATGALLAMCANLLDVILGFGDTGVAIYGTKTAVDRFGLFQANSFKGLYTLGILNIVYMTCMVPVYLALFVAHREKNRTFAALAMLFFLVGIAIYVSNNAAIPMCVLSGKYAAAGTDAQRTIFAAAGEAVLAHGEDFTPGSFIGLIFSGIAAIAISTVMLRGGIFAKSTAWIGIVGFTFLSFFTILSTFVPSLYILAFYVFGMIGGLLALAWFLLVARRLFQLGRT